MLTVLMFLSVVPAADPLPDSADVQTRDLRLRHAGVVHGIAYSPDGKLLAAAGTVLGETGGEVRLWEPATGKPLGVLAQHAAPILTLCFSPDCRWLAGGCEDGAILVWDLASRRVLFRNVQADQRVISLAFNTNGQQLAAAFDGGSVLLWDASGWRKRDLKLPSATCVSFSPDGQLLAASSLEQVVKCWDVATGQERRVLKTNQGAWSVAFAPTGHTLAVGTEGDLLLWELSGGQSRRLMREGCFPALAFSGDGQVLAAADYMGEQLRLFDRVSGRQRRTLPFRFNFPLALAFAADRQTLAVPQDHTVTLLAWPALVGPRR